MRRIALRILGVLVGVALATPAFAHAELLSTDPAANALLDTAPTTITLTFNEVTQPTVMALIGPDGKSTTLTDIQQRGPSVIVTAPPMDQGTQVLSWRVVSADGHPVGGGLVFSVGTITGAAANVGASSTNTTVGVLIWIFRVLIYLGLFIGVAGAFFTAWIAAPAGLPPRARTTLRWVSIVGLVAVPFAFALQGVDLLGGTIGDAFSTAAWSQSIKSSYVGTLAFAVVGFVTALVSLGQKTPNKVLTAVGLIAIGVAFSLSGHAATAPPTAVSWLVVLVHTTTVAFWIGSLFPLAVLLRSPTPANLGVLSRFSAVIPFAIAPLIVAGGLLILIQLDRISDLWNTTYGLILAAKLILVIALLLIALYNRRRLTPLVAAKPSEGALALRRSIGWEMGLVIVVFGLVAGWRFTPPPRAVDAAVVAQAPTNATLTGDNIAANVAIAPAKVGPVNLTVSLADQTAAPLTAQQVDVTIANSTAGIAPISQPATQQPDGSWTVSNVLLPQGGTWQIQVAAMVSTFERRTANGTFNIEDPNAPPPQSQIAVTEIPTDESVPHTHPAAPNIDVTDPNQVIIEPDAASSPTIAMNVSEVDQTTWNLSFQFGNWRFATLDDGIDHVNGVGHAHVFVNNNYLEEIYADTYQLTLPDRGVYDIFVGLNGLDHRSYVLDGALVAQRVQVKVPDRGVISDDRVEFDVNVDLSNPNPPTFAVQQGQSVEIHLTSVDPETIRLHGVDMETTIAPNSPDTLLFLAEVPGRFVAEAHDDNLTPVFFVEVRP